ncbi:MAG: ATP synthase F1 subunit delta, partial [Bacteroidota bacterium]
SNTTSSFVQLIVTKGREKELVSIASSFVDQVNRMRGVHHAEVISAVVLDKTSKKAVLKMAEKMAGGQIILNERIDPSLIGGFIVRVNGQEYNASVTGKLNKIKKDFSKNPYVPAL